MKANLICADCKSRVKGYGFICYDVLEQVCRDAITEQYSVYHGEEGMDTLIEFLEKKGLLISTDIHDNLILLLPNTRHGIQCKNVFCWCEKKEKEKYDDSRIN